MYNHNYTTYQIANVYFSVFAVYFVGSWLEYFILLKFISLFIYFGIILHLSVHISVIYQKHIIVLSTRACKLYSAMSKTLNALSFLKLLFSWMAFFRFLDLISPVYGTNFFKICFVFLGLKFLVLEVKNVELVRSINFLLWSFCFITKTRKYNGIVRQKNQWNYLEINGLLTRFAHVFGINCSKF